MHFYNLPPDGTSPNALEHQASDVPRARGLLANFALMHGDGGPFKNLAIYEGLIALVWFSDHWGAAIGERYAADFDNGMPLWLIANFGATVSRRLLFLTPANALRYQLVFNVTSFVVMCEAKSEPDFKSNVFCETAHALHSALVSLSDDPVDGPAFNAYLRAWVESGRCV